MREIEFRACLKSENKIYRVENLDFDKNEAYLSECGWYNFDEIELIEYTGIKDKNGVKIFEGNIVNICGFTDKDVVEYDNYYVGYVLKSYDKNGKVIYITPLIEYSSITAPKLEVIGNIWEHKELLNEQPCNSNTK